MPAAPGRRVVLQLLAMTEGALPADIRYLAVTLANDPAVETKHHPIGIGMNLDLSAEATMSDRPNCVECAVSSESRDEGSLARVEAVGVNSQDFLMLFPILTKYSGVVGTA